MLQDFFAFYFNGVKNGVKFLNDTKITDLPA